MLLSRIHLSSLLLIGTLFFGNFSALAQTNKGVTDCVSCHKTQVSDWKKSDHAKAMDIASDKTILGNFNNITVTHYSQTARFYKKDAAFYMEMNHEGNTATYKIDFTFGHYPLQQYLVKTTQGKYQVLPFSWDSRPKSEGGQKWFVIYQDEDIKQNDRLHWKQPLQNWNGMCADCHSDGLKRNYDSTTDQFNTTYDNINVGCQSCHGEMPKHDKLKKSEKHIRTQPNIINKWLREAGKTTAIWKGGKRDNAFMDTCFACHSLRSPLTDGIEPTKPFLDQFSPSFLSPPMYHPDGQIKEEVYVYGSFLQSKMYKAGVNCIDCHDQHTMKIKAPDNGLCLQCHSAETFNTKTHTGHQEQTEASQCVSCHMPNTTYMGVDARRDHSFKVPQPHLSTSTNTPNVCTNCHENKDNEWAAKSLEKWHGKPKGYSKTYQHFLDIQNGKPVQLQDHLELINDKTLNAIVRATAITALVQTTQSLSDNTIKPWVNDKEPLIRLAVARVGQLVLPEHKTLTYASLLSDKLKAIRTAAANHLINVNSIDQTLLKKAFDELVTANEINTWRGEGHLNQSMTYYKNGQLNKTISSLKSSIDIDPYFPAAYINLADIYKSTGDTRNERAIFDKALKALPNDGMIHYSFGLHLIRTKQKQQSIDAFKQAVKLEPHNGQYLYLYILAKDNVGQTKQALMQLRMMISKINNPTQLAQLGMSLAQKTSDQKSYQFFSRYLR